MLGGWVSTADTQPARIGTMGDDGSKEEAAEVAAVLLRMQSAPPEEADAAASSLAEYAQQGERSVAVLCAAGGVDALTALLLGSSGGEDGQGLMRALLDAASQPLPPRRCWALRALTSIAKFPQHKGAVSGSGVMGVLTMLLLATKEGVPVQSAAVRAQVTRANPNPNPNPTLTLTLTPSRCSRRLCVRR